MSYPNLNNMDKNGSPCNRPAAPPPSPVPPMDYAPYPDYSPNGYRVIAPNGQGNHPQYGNEIHDELDPAEVHNNDTEGGGAIASGRYGHLGSSVSALENTESVEAVVRLLQEALPKISDALNIPGPSSASTFTHPQQITRDQSASHVLSASPVFLVGHPIPPLSIVTLEKAPVGSPSRSPLPTSAGPTAASGVAPFLWKTGSCLLYPAVDDRCPLIRSSRSDAATSCNQESLARGCAEIENSRPRRCFSKFTKGQLLTISSMFLIDFSSFASMSILAPFFPYQMEERNLSSTLDGFIFSIYALVIVLASPIIGKLLPLMNLRTVYILGITVAGASNVLFGLVVYIPDAEVFAIAAIALRVMCALGTAHFLTVIYSLVPVIFPDDLNTVNGILETAVGVGMCVGPAVGVWLYSIGGFPLPFYGLGFFILLCVPVCYITFPNHEVSVLPPSENVNITTVLCNPGAMLSLLILCTTAVSLAILYPTLQPHMSGLGVSVEGVGLVFLLMSAVYAVSAPLIGLATDRYICPWGFMLFGLVVVAVGLVLIGNSPILPHITHDQLYHQDVVAIVILGLASAMCIVPSFAAILQTAARDGEIIDIATYSIVGGLWSAAYSLGEMLGPLYAGIMAEYVTFAMSTTVTALLPASLALVLGTYMLVTSHRSRKSSS